MKYCVYLHRNAITKEVFYVGCGSIKRPSFFGNREKEWKQYVSINGLPIIEILEIVDSKEDSFKIEQKYISKYKRICDGGTLINKTNGGKGPNGLIVTNETRLLLSSIKKGRKLSNEFKLKLSESAKNSEKVKEKIKKLTASKYKLILDKKTGVFYNGVKEAADCYGIKQGTLTHKLNGRLKNNTNLVYA